MLHYDFGNKAKALSLIGMNTVETMGKITSFRMRNVFFSRSAWYARCNIFVYNRLTQYVFMS